MASDAFVGVRIYEPTTEKPCVVCSGYPRGWAEGVVHAGEIVLCADHRDWLRGVIEAANV